MARKRKNGKNGKLQRRDFLRKIAAGGAVAGTLGSLPAAKGLKRSRTEGLTGSNIDALGQSQNPAIPKSVSSGITYPRVFAGPNLKMIAFPLGGIGTGSVALGGRGELRDWEIFNRPDKGNVPGYCFASIWVKAGSQKPVARVLEA